MSLLGFDAIGRLALAQIQRGNLSMPAVSGSFAVSGAAQTFKLTENVTAGSFTVSGVPITEKIGLSAGSFSLTGTAQTLKITENVSAGAYVITGAVSNNVNGAADPGAFHWTGIGTPLIWTGAGVDTSYTGGVGHFLEEIERVKRLKAITRKIPAPIDRRTNPSFQPLRGPPSAPAAPVPDMAAIQNQRATEVAAQAARAQRRRRDEEAVLLLAS
jgi:hypothetical protein